METLKEHLILKNRFASIYNNEVRFQSGERGTHILIDTKNSVSVLPITNDGNFVLVEVYRYAKNGYSIEFPAGGVEPQEIPLLSASRELHEEAKLASPLLTHHYRTTGNASTHKAFCDNYIAWSCVDESSPPKQDLYEDIKRTIVVSPLGLYEMCLDGTIEDLSTIATTMRFFGVLSPVKPSDLEGKGSAYIMGVYYSALGLPKKTPNEIATDYEPFLQGYQYRHHIKVVR